jgi:hypothetical protein
MINDLEVADIDLWKYVDDTTISETVLQGRKKTFSSWEQNLETKITCRPTEYFCAKSACA